MQRIYIALPEEKARAHMFKVHLGDTPHDLSPQDFEELARHTEGFSGSDVAVVVKDVLMEPVRLTQDAGYFRLVPILVDVYYLIFPIARKLYCFHKQCALIFGYKRRTLSAGKQ